MTSTIENSSSLVGLGFILSFVLAYGVGANNVANTFGTVVATKTVLKRNSSSRKLGIVFEVIGALLTCMYRQLCRWFNYNQGQHV